MMGSSLLLMDPASVLLGGVLVLCVLWWLSTRRLPGLPPGPGPALPLLGHLYLLAKDPRPQFWAWRRQYGDVFSLYMGGRLVVVLASYSAIREALVTFADVFSDRALMFFTEKVNQNGGILAASGPSWKEQRKTSLQILRQMGMGKNALAEKIQEEITHYIRAIQDHQGAPVDLHHLTLQSVCNNISSILFGKRFHYDDAAFSLYTQNVNDLSKLMGNSSTINFFPLLEHLPGDYFQAKLAVSKSEEIKSFIREQVRAKMQTCNDSTEALDFIHAYLKQMQERQDTASSLNESNLVKSCFDLFAAGTETTATAIRWALVFFLHYPEVQEKCYREICDTVGPTRPPSIQKKADMVYMEATVTEVLRKGNVVPLSLMHCPTCDVTFRNYVIPKDAFVIPCLDILLADPDIWGDPENFRPERFIGPDGKVTRLEEFIPFGMGRRVCLGESLARMELFLYLATLIQHFRFLPPEDGQLPSLEGILGISYTPKPFKIRAEIRK